MASVCQSSIAVVLLSGAAAAAKSASISINVLPNQARRMRPISSSGKKTPAQRLAGVERNDAVNNVWHPNFGPFEGHRALAERQAIETWAVDGRERFQLVESVLLLEHGRIALERERRVEHAGAAAGAFL